MTGRSAVLTTSVCLLLVACSGKIDPTATGNGPGGAASSGSSSGNTANGSTGSDSANASDGDFVNGSGPSTGTDPGGPSSGGPCFTIELGKSCSWSTAQQICSPKGYAVVALSSTSAGSCQATCCPGKGPPPPPPPPTPCTYEQVGDGVTCLSYSEIKTQASNVCDAQKLSVRSVYPANDCPGGATITKVECCGPK